MSQDKDLAFEPFDHDLGDYEDHFLEKESESEKLDDVRGESDLAKAKKLSPKGQKALLVSLIFLGLIVSGLVIVKMTSGNKTDEPTKEEVKTSFETPEKRDFGQEYIQAEESVYDFSTNDDGVKEPVVVARETEPQEDVGGIAGYSQPSPTVVYEPISQVPEPTQPAPISVPSEPENNADMAMPVVEAVKTPEEKRNERIFGGFSSVKSSSSVSSNNNNANQSNGNGNKLSTGLSPTVLDGTSASRMANRDFMLTKGSMIDCVLNTKFDSTVVGMIACTVTRNIYSASGRVVLIDRGSRVIGEYQGGMAQGDNRVFVLWNRIETPKGVVINIDSPAAGSLGEAGVDGRIDNKFWKRFGGAMLVSLVSDMGRAASEAVATKTIGGNVRLEDSTNTAQQMAMTELEKSINIPPSLIKHQGDRLSIYVARDVYFGNVYGLKAK